MIFYEYYKNEYCGDRGIGRDEWDGEGNKTVRETPDCSCPHWFSIKIENLFTRIFEPHCYITICKRKRVYEIRYENCVPKDFWIDVDNRTQEKGKYIHSYGLQQAAKDIKQIHQMAKMIDYQRISYAKYHSNIFKKKEDHPSQSFCDMELSEIQRMVPEYLKKEFFQDNDGFVDREVEENLRKVLQYVIDKENRKGKFERKKNTTKYSR